jgi:hypothetical protein
LLQNRGHEGEFQKQAWPEEQEETIQPPSRSRHGAVQEANASRHRPAYPYLLRDLGINRPNQVSTADIFNTGQGNRFTSLKFIHLLKAHSRRQRTYEDL